MSSIRKKAGAVLTAPGRALESVAHQAGQAVDRADQDEAAPEDQGDQGVAPPKVVREATGVNRGVGHNVPNNPLPLTATNEAFPVFAPAIQDLTMDCSTYQVWRVLESVGC